MTQRASQGHSESRQGPSEERPSVPWSLGRLHSGFSRPWSRTVNRHAVGWTSGSRAWPQAGRSGLCVCGGGIYTRHLKLNKPPKNSLPWHSQTCRGLSRALLSHKTVPRSLRLLRRRSSQSSWIFLFPSLCEVLTQTPSARPAASTPAWIAQPTKPPRPEPRVMNCLLPSQCSCPCSRGPRRVYSQHGAPGRHYRVVKISRRTS